MPPKGEKKTLQSKVCLMKQEKIDEQPFEAEKSGTTQTKVEDTPFDAKEHKVC